MTLTGSTVLTVLELTDQLQDNTSCSAGRNSTVSFNNRQSTDLETTTDFTGAHSFYFITNSQQCTKLSNLRKPAIRSQDTSSGRLQAQSKSQHSCLFNARSLSPRSTSGGGIHSPTLLTQVNLGRRNTHPDSAHTVQSKCHWHGMME